MKKPSCKNVPATKVLQNLILGSSVFRLKREIKMLDIVGPMFQGPMKKSSKHCTKAVVALTVNINLVLQMHLIVGRSSMCGQLFPAECRGLTCN